jgi:hypothetical protein
MAARASSIVIGGAFPQVNSCKPRALDPYVFAGPFLERRERDAEGPREVTVTDVLTLVTGIALATENHPDPAAEAEGYSP